MKRYSIFLYFYKSGFTYNANHNIFLDLQRIHFRYRLKKYGYVDFSCSVWSKQRRKKRKIFDFIRNPRNGNWKIQAYGNSLVDRIYAAHAFEVWAFIKPICIWRHLMYREQIIHPKKFNLSRKQPSTFPSGSVEESKAWIQRADSSVSGRKFDYPQTTGRGSELRKENRICGDRGSCPGNR